MSSVKQGNKKALIETFVARFLAAIGTLCLGVVVARLYGPEGLGAYALAQSFVLGVAIVSRFGGVNALTLYVGRSPYSSATSKYFLWSMLVALVLSLMFAGASYIFLREIISYFDEGDFKELIPGFLLAAPAFTLSFISSGMLKGIKRPARSALAENGVVSIVTTLLVLIASYAGYDGVVALGYCYAASAWLVFLWTLKAIFKWFDCEYSVNKHEDADEAGFKEYIKSSINFFLLNATQLVQQVFSFMIASKFITMEEVGFLRAAERTALLVGFVQVVINAVYPAKFAKAYHERRVEDLESLSRESATVATVLCFPLLFVCVFFPDYVLSLFGGTFQEAAQVLTVLAMAQGVNVSLGSVTYMLQMTGHGATARNVALLTSGVSLALYFYLGANWGLMGVAYAFAAGIVILNILNAIMVRRLLGFWIYPSFGYRKKNA